MRYCILILALILISCFISCPNPPEEERDTSIYLELINTWTTSVTLRISVEDTSQSWNYSLSRDNASTGTYAVSGSEEIITDHGLDPNHEYSYRAYWLEGSVIKDSSDVITTTTMDTTSHDFIWTVDTIAFAGGWMYDIHGSSKNDVWVVGQFRVSDTVSSANAAHWNGDIWEPTRVDPAPYGFSEMFAVFALSENDVWFVSGCAFHWDGLRFTPHCSAEGFYGGYAYYDIWASARDDVYFVGAQGKIVHYDGDSFHLMESGTTQKLRRITGWVDQTTGLTHLWVASNGSYPNRGLLLYYDGIEWETIWDDNHPFFPETQYLDAGGIWAFKNGELVLYTGGSIDGQITHHKLTNLNDYNLLLKSRNGFIRNLHGNNFNDYFASGDLSNLIHYNGLTFRSFHDLGLTGEVTLTGVYMSDNQVFVAGYAGGIVLRGIRN